MSYSIEEVARMCNVTRQSIYNKLKKDIDPSFINESTGYKKITEEGLLFFKEVYNVQEETAAEEFTKDFKEIVEEIKELYKDLLAEKESTIEYLKKENARLLELMEQQNKLILNSQINEQKSLSNTEVLLLEKQKELEERKKQFQENKESDVNNKNWFNRLFTSKN